MIVVDANVVVYLLVPGTYTAQAEHVRVAQKAWIVPPLFPHEFLNVLWKHVRAGDLDRDEAIKTYRRGLAIVRVPVINLDPVEVLGVAESPGCSTYDAEYVWLARDLGLRLVTEDQKLLRACPDVATPMSSFT